MGRITKYLAAIIRRQVKQYGIVVWYDPPGHYQNAVDELDLDDIPLHRYEDSFFNLRYEIESYIEMNQRNVPNLLVYAAIDPMDYHGTLAEVESCGIIMQPGMLPPERNTALAYIARQALAPVLSDDRLDEIERETEQGLYSLADLERLGEYSDVSFDQVLLIFDTENASDVALRFLNEPDKYDARIEERVALSELCALLQSEYGVDLPDNSIDAMRRAFARHILITDLLIVLGNEIPARLVNIALPEGHIIQDNCIRLAQTWRDSRQYEDIYVALSREVEDPLNLSSIGWSISQLEDIDTFYNTEKALQALVEQALLEDASQEIVELATEHKRHFWSTASTGVQSRWSLISTAGRLILMADNIDRVLQREASYTAREIVDLYTQGERPWCLLDTYHRQVELLWVEIYNNFTPSDNLEKLVMQGRKRYIEVASALSKTFMEQYENDGFQLGGLQRQSEIYHSQVDPLVKRGKVAYVLVDALRYEMAFDLVTNVLSEDFNAQLQSMVATVPTITEIGMAALMPNADRGQIVEVGEGKLGYQIDDTILKERSDRVEYLKQFVAGNLLDLKLDELRIRRKAVQDKIAEADFILVTSQEIDQFGETGEQGIARETMDNMLRNLHFGLRLLRENGVQNIIVTADHGHIFIDNISDDMKIDKPGEGIDVHRRSWVGKYGIEDHRYLYTPLSNFGLESEFDYAAPYNFLCFKVSSSLNYFHGGLSPQELIVPSIAITVHEPERVAVSDIVWQIQPGSQTIGRVFTVTISGQSTEMFDIHPPKLRVAVQIGEEEISRPISASYNLEPSTGYIQMRTKENEPLDIENNTVTLLVELGEIKSKIAKVILYNVETDQVLSESSKMEITIYD